MKLHNVLIRPTDLFEEILRRKLISGGGGAVLQTVTGISPLTLLNVASRGIKSLTQFGKCEQASSPTPSAPINIKCNNGTLKGRMASGLPVGYRKLEYIESTGTQYINTGFVIPDLTNEYEVEYKITISGGTGQGQSSNNWGYMGQNGCLMLTLTGTNGVGAASGGVPWVADHIYEISHHRGSDASRSLTVDGTTFQFANQTTIYADRKFGIFSLSPFTTNFNRIYGKLYDFKAYKNGELVVSLIPCKRMSDNAIGVYDIVNDTFIGNSGTSAFIAGADDDETYIDVVGTPEVLTVVNGRCILSVVLGGTIESRSGTNGTENNKRARIEYQYLKAGTYTLSTSGVCDQAILCSYSSGQGADFEPIGSWGWVALPQTFTLESGRYIRAMVRKSTDKVLTSENIGDFQIDVVNGYPEHQTQTASVENLLGVGDYKDEQEIISGGVTHKVGVKVFDGTENWTLTSSSSGCIVFSVDVNAHSIQGWSKITSLCTHFECYVGNTSPTYIVDNVGKFWLNTAGQYFRFVTDGTMSLSQFKAFLAEQYANGTPVVVVYPLAEPTTEQVTAQHLSARDTATITAQTNNISDITLEVQYWQKAE